MERLITYPRIADHTSKNPSPEILMDINGKLLQYNKPAISLISDLLLKDQTTFSNKLLGKILNCSSNNLNILIGGILYRLIFALNTEGYHLYFFNIDDF